MKQALFFFLFCVVCVTLTFGLSSAFTDVIVHLGRNIPQTDVVTDYYTGLVWAAFLGLTIILWPVPLSHKKPLAWAWLAKCFVTMFVMLFYEAHYEDIDMFGLFAGSTNKWFVWENFRNGTLNMRQLCWLHAQVFPDSYHLMKVNCSYVGFIAVYLFYRAATEYLGHDDFRYLAAMFISPSLHFFSSTLGKDPIILLGIGLYAYGFTRWYRTRSMGYIGLMLLGAGETMLIRNWMGPILLAPLAVLTFLRVRGPSKVLLMIPICVLLVASTSGFQNQFGISSAGDMVTRVDDITHSTGWEGGSGRQSIRFTNLGVMAAFIPVGIFTALFRPLLGEVNNPFGIVVGLENLVYLWLLFEAFRRTRLQELSNDIVLLWAVLLILIWGAFYGFASFQNMGAAVRYRLQIQPILLGLLFFLGRRRTAASPIALPNLTPQPNYHEKTAG